MSAILSRLINFALSLMISKTARFAFVSLFGFGEAAIISAKQQLDAKSGDFLSRFVPFWNKNGTGVNGE
jgi:hypothetical protein